MIARLRAVVADPSVRWLALARVLSLLAAPLTLYLLVTRQPVSARGFYLIAINIVTLAQLFETGMGTMVVQFATHVRPSERGTLRAAAEQWFRRAATVVLALGATAGTLVMIRGAESASVNFFVPWAVVLATTAAYVGIVPLIGLREGGGDVEGVQRMRAAQAVLMAAAMVGGLWRGSNIGAAALAGVAQLVAAAWYLVKARRCSPEASCSWRCRPCWPGSGRSRTRSSRCRWWSDAARWRRPVSVAPRSAGRRAPRPPMPSSA